MAQQIKFYTDEHVPKAVVKGLLERSVDVLSVPEAGLRGARPQLSTKFLKGPAYSRSGARNFGPL